MRFFFSAIDFAFFLFSFMLFLDYILEKDVALKECKKLLEDEIQRKETIFTGNTFSKIDRHTFFVLFLR